jgi:small subunit ribosomal protein S16
MLKIRLQRTGKRGQAYFKVVVTEHTQKPKGQYLELLGSYDPHKNKITVDIEKVKHWLGQGAKMSETVNNLLVGRGVIEGEKVTVWKPKKKKGGETPTEASSAKKVPAAETKLEATEDKKEEAKEEIKPEEPVAAPAETPAVAS